MGPTTQCSMSEHTCTNGKCISMNKFCDKSNDCGDSSDEPRFCTRKFYLNLIIAKLYKSSLMEVMKLCVFLLLKKKSVFIEFRYITDFV